jgi:hypothetical protein
MWQMDFKGWVPLANGAACHPLTVIDDHSVPFGVLRPAPTSDALRRTELTTTFCRYGLPDAIPVDNGTPWGDGRISWTKFGALQARLSMCSTAGPITRRPAVRTNAPAPSKPRCSRSSASGPGRSAVRAFDEWRAVYNRSVRIKPSSWRCRATAIGQAGVPCPPIFPRSNMTKARSPAASPHTKAYVSFSAACGRSPRRSGERLAIRPVLPTAKHGIFFGAREIAHINLRTSETGERP